jgi:flagellin
MAAINAKVGEHGLFAESTGTTGTYSTVGDALNSSGAPAGITVVYGTSSAAGITSGVGVTGSAPGAGEVKGLADLDVTTYLNASRAVSIVDKALTAVNSARADLGAVQNRFTSVVGNLQTSSENLAASRSRIRDTDFAKETAELTRTQILQQAGTAMLAQANQVPQNVLSLLR